LWNYQISLELCFITFKFTSVSEIIQFHFTNVIFPNISSSHVKLSDFTGVIFPNIQGNLWNIFKNFCLALHEVATTLSVKAFLHFDLWCLPFFVQNSAKDEEVYIILYFSQIFRIRFLALHVKLDTLSPKIFLTLGLECIPFEVQKSANKNTNSSLYLKQICLVFCKYLTPRHSFLYKRLLLSLRVKL
jgi:hypothetical protein